VRRARGVVRARPGEDAAALASRRKLTECDVKLARYRDALEAGTDPSIVGGWIEEVKLERKAAELQLRRRRGDTRLTGEEIRSLVEQLKGIVAILQTADPEDRRAVYQELNVSIRYHTDGRLHVKAGPSACTNECVGGGT
jgi:site-specific DNA recombinase